MRLTYWWTVICRRLYEMPNNEFIENMIIDWIKNDETIKCLRNFCWMVEINDDFQLISSDLIERHLARYHQYKCYTSIGHGVFSMGQMCNSVYVCVLRLIFGILYGSNGFTNFPRFFMKIIKFSKMFRVLCNKTMLKKFNALIFCN